MTYTNDGGSSTPYQDALNQHGSKAAAARALGIAVTTFKDRLNSEKYTPPRIKHEYTPMRIRCELPKFVKLLYFTDAHNQPGMPLDRFKWLGGLIDDQKPDILLDGGDFDDFQSLCSHEGNETYKGKLKPSLARDLEASALARKTLADSHSHDCRKIVTLGNHEQRLWNYENANPEMYGIVSNLYTDILKATGWEYYPYGEYVDIHGISATHVPFNVMGKPVGGETACKQIADKSLKDVIFGHTHKKDEWNAAKFGASVSVTAFNGGCFMPDGYVPAYSKDTRKEFWYGAHVITISNGRIKSIKSWHMSELEALYGRNN